MPRRWRKSSGVTWFAAVLAALLARVPTVSVAAAAVARGPVLLAQAEGGDSAEAPPSEGGAVDNGAVDDGGAGAAPRAPEPKPLATSVDPNRWRSSRPLKPLKGDHYDDEHDADVDAAHEEATMLRREAADLRAALDRLTAQQKRGARVPSEDADTIRRRAEDIETQIGELQRRAGDLDSEAEDLQGHEEKPIEPEARRRKTDEAVAPPAIDPLSGDIDDPLDDDDSDSLD